ncbi:ATP-binding cassette, subfamily C (CFTR/MRP), member 1 [Entomortierella parvispora]|uniref:ATP-binding cassette, subfamily C (CFTR/MRP), member 1 n=1 Tax=Entomortierella parvispora TaxID=205924 RepID=A0A9P3LUT2_9FUNG|nr:ATP-binding cassette, subfamily C (CFTR/MRP), member 1 [Entomortierella parvispora]
MDASSSSPSSLSPSSEWCGPQGWGPTADDQIPFTPCFQNTVLFAIPALIASFSFFSRYTYLSRHHGLGHARSPLLFWPNQIAMTSAVVIVLGHAVHTWDQTTGSSILATLTLAVSWILAIYLNNKESIYKIRASSSILLYTFWTILALIPNVIALHGDKGPQSISTYRFYVSYLISISLAFVIQIWPRDSIHDDPEATLYDQANVLSRWTYQYMQTIISRGYRAPLTENDLQDVMPRDLNTLEGPYQTLSAAWNLHLKQTESYNKAQAKLSTSSTKTTKKREPDLFWLVLRAFKAPLFYASFLNVLQTLSQFLLPFVLQKLLRYLDSDVPTSQTEGILLAIALFAVTVLAAILIGQFYMVIQDTAIKIRSALVSMIYRKAMVLSPGSRKGSTTGEITNHMSTDAERWLMDLLWIPLCISVPLHIIVSMVMLYSILGWSIFMAVAVVIIVMPLQAKAATYLDSVGESKMDAQDRRVRLMSEILANIKIIKLYSYDVAFKNRVKDVRREELANVKKFGMTITFLTIVFTSLPVFMLMVTIMVYATIGGPDFTPGVINAEKIFVSITVFALLNQPVGDVSQIIECMIGLRVASRRIQTFLLKEEMDPSAVQHVPHLPRDPRTPAIQFSDATLAWGPETENEETGTEDEEAHSETTALLSAENVKKASLPTLFDINISIEKSSLTAVVGRVGQGKSSLLSALIGDMYKRQGSVKLFGSLAYVPQQAWIVNATVRDNILFGKPFDQRRYDQILFAAGLLPDLEILAAGDATEIGERGINLSGGQKQRISLARAAYQDADVYLLDDPLSAVDAHVDQHLWKNLIGPEGLLKDKTRVLVTHGIHHLDQVDSILVIKDGRVTETGHFKELMKAKNSFYQLINEFSARNAKGNKSKKAKKKDADAVAASASSSASASDEDGETDTIIGGADGKDNDKKGGEKKDNEGDGDLVEEEQIQEGAVSVGTFMHYVRAMSFTYFGMLVGFYVLWEMFQLSVPIWMQHWTSVVDTTDKPVVYYLAIYAGLVLSYMICDVYLTYICFVLACPQASLVMHEQILERVIRLPMSFFDTTPQGRILNRFSSDMSEIDDHVSNCLTASLQCILNMVGSLVVVAVATPMIMLAIPPMALIYWIVQEYYIRTSTVLKRLESKTKSPIYQHFTESLHGCSSIRAMNLQDRFVTENAQKLDQYSMMFYCTYMTNRWLNLRLQSLCAVIVFFSALLAVLNRDSINPSMAGLALSFTLTLADHVVWSLRLYCRLVGSLVSVERVHEYTIKNTEAPLTTGVHLPESWPQHGQITFQNYSARYREGLDLVLKDVSFDVQPGAKVGVVGRTGAGKSSLTLALFRIIEAADSYWAKSSDNSSNASPISEALVSGNGGSILIDGIDISTLGLADLRKHLSIIPQDPTLFAGSVRQNLDPFGEHDDQELWTALERAHLKDHIRTLEGGLSFEVSQGGENFSVGQRSLICLARALLRKTKILILDEATAAVDVETDELIQTTIRKEFKDRTILTIAHRIKTVMDSDMILVMEKGQVSEYDPPQTLLKRKETSLFYQLAEQAGEIH